MASSKLYDLATGLLRRAASLKEKYGLGFVPVPILRVLISPLAERLDLLYRGDIYRLDGDIDLEQLAGILPIRVVDEFALPFGLHMSGTARLQMTATGHLMLAVVSGERRFTRVVGNPTIVPPLLDWRSGYYDDRWTAETARLDVTFGKTIRFVVFAPVFNNSESKMMRLVSRDSSIELDVPRGQLFTTPTIELTEDRETILLETGPAEPLTKDGDSRRRGLFIHTVHVNGRPRQSCNLSLIPLLD